MPFVFSLSNSSTGVRDRVVQALARAGMRSPLIALEGDLTAPHLAVAAERGWTLITRSRAQAPPEGTVVLSVAGLSVSVAVIAVWRRAERRPVVLTVLRRMLDLARSYPDSEVPATVPLPAPPRPFRTQRQPGMVPSGITLRYLRALTSVASAHSIGRAAERLGISQPALSRQLSELEHGLGITLLDRSARGVTRASRRSQSAARRRGNATLRAPDVGAGEDSSRRARARPAGPRPGRHGLDHHAPATPGSNRPRKPASCFAALSLMGAHRESPGPGTPSRCPRERPGNVGRRTGFGSGSR